VEIIPRHALLLYHKLALEMPEDSSNKTQAQAEASKINDFTARYRRIVLSPTHSFATMRTALNL